MNDQFINAAVEHFLKKVSLSAQREIEKSLRAAIASGTLRGNETFTAAVTVSSEKLGLNTTIYNKIEL
jgi:uncharacterized membrane protein YqiK